MGLLLFVGIPLLELFLLTRVSSILGFGPTVLLVIVTGVVGSRLARSQGAQVWTRIQQELAAGRIPTSQGVDALLVLAAGLMLVTPGVLTDAVGLAFLLPFIRSAIRPTLVRWLKSKMNVRTHAQGARGPYGQSGPSAANHSPTQPQSRTDAFDPFHAKRKGPVVEADVVEPDGD